MYITLASPANFKEVIKGSSFIAYADRVDSVEVAMEFLKGIKKEHPNATHHCWAYHIADQYRFSDDGEPGGTAGRPMLEIITRQGLDRVVAVTVRYFGGVKLGAGGLVRAYSGTLAKALNKVKFVEVRPQVNLTLLVPFAKSDMVFRFLKSLDVSIEKTQYSELGTRLDIVTFLGEEESLISELNEITCGEIKVGYRY